MLSPGGGKAELQGGQVRSASPWLLRFSGRAQLPLHPSVSLGASDLLVSPWRPGPECSCQAWMLGGWGRGREPLGYRIFRLFSWVLLFIPPFRAA